ncbi:dUTP diphosphatase [Candidatus Macondimonas diazotrophica]|jgi:dUTP pyrophosphatase|uniref:Deoxyuridine 5'-triphosphate nucleotidohydrolase n=1 Tax=Candidatus Macondimonas diazotrophica TaxID=2305248 RepID=A0A4Z0F7L8_9GAMM|nr:dUTP diphosphatase [Candidatus Macondimonas diazotrophica]TFZ81187.1 dUTP diphosphatase [Candidatus Macondimonas diazotrophica]
MHVNVLVKLLDNITLPKYATAGSGAVDLQANISRALRILPGAVKTVPTGLAVALPEGYGMFISSRSGLAIQHNIIVLNAPGLIDSDYRGEVRVVLKNTGDTVFFIHPGARVAQAFLVQLPTIQWRVVQDLPDTDRGAGGFGHTGTA